jgi:hypothetical protein
MEKEIVVALVGFLGTLVGVIVAIINRKRFIVHQYESRSYYDNGSQTAQPSRVGKRFKKFLVCGGLAFVTLFVAALASAAATDSNSRDGIASFFMIPFGIFVMLAVYQVIAMFFLVVGWALGGS